MEQSCDVSQTECGEKSSLFNSEVQEPEGLNMAFLFCAGLLIVFLFLRLWTSSRERKLVIFEEYQNVEDSEELTFLKKACVLVVSYEFENDSLMKRNSIEDDLANLRKTFQLKRNCNYKEIASPNAAELLEILKNEQELLKLFEISAVPAVLFIVLLSHVKSDNIILTDHMDSDGNYKRFETTEIFEAIKNTPDLKDQLNVIFFGPSKGNFDDFSNAEKDSSPEYENQTSSRFIITPRVDNLVLVSSVETNTSLGSTKDGTWFVKEICRMVDDLDKDEPLEVFLTKFQHSAHCNLQEICHTTGENNSSHRNFVICKSVSETEVSSEPQSDWTFMMAARFSDVEMCRSLVENGADLCEVDEFGDDALHLACLEGKLENARYLLGLTGFSVEKRGQFGQTALHKAASKGHVAVAELLLSLGADINARDDNDDTPLILAAQFSSEDMCRFLVEKGADIYSVDKYGEKILHPTCLKMTRENAMYLLRFIDFSVEKKGRSGRTALHKAARKDQVAMVELLLSLGADVNACDDDDDTPLHHAARKGHVAVAKILLSKGADVTARNDDDETPLHRAADNGHVALAELLLSNGSDVNARNKNGYTPLHHAASNGHVSVAELLLSKGADVNARNKNENTPLNVAVQISSKEMCQFLVGHNADLSVVDRNGDNALHLACLEGKLDIVKYFLRLNAFSLEQRGQLGRTALHKAAGKGHIAVAELLLSLGADINAHDDNNDTPLILAAQFSSEDMCRFLVEKGTDINSVDKYGENIVHLACLKGTRENAMYLLRLIDFSVEKKGQSGRTALHKAARKDQVAMAELLLSLGADVNACDDDDDTPLHHAARKGHVAVAKILLSKGANVNARNDDDEIPLHHAADNGHVSVAELLLSKGADVNARDENEDTPLNVAAQISSKEMCQFLVGHNADLSAVDGNGDNALHLACLEGKLDIVKYFLRLNAFCLEKEGQLGRTALHHAASKDHVAVAKYLLSKGAEVNATDENNDTPLKVAANSSNEAMFKFLVEHIMLHGLSLLDEDQEQTLWQLACIDGVWHYSM